MEFIIFFFLLLLHILLLQFNVRKLASPLGLYGLMWLGLLMISRIGIIKYNSLSIKAITVFFINYFMFLLGSSTIKMALVNRKLKYIDYKNFKINNGNYLLLTIRLLLAISLIGTIINWIISINMFHSLKFIFENAFFVRTQLIGNSKIPALSSYLSSLANTAAALSAFYIIFISPKKVSPYMSIAVNLLNDLLTFGRTGTIWAVMFFISTYIISIYLNKNTFNLKKFIKVVVIVFFAVSVTSIPRLVRGGGAGFSGTLHNLGNSLNITSGTSTLLDGIISYYVYATGSFTAFSEYIESAEPGGVTKGKALFTPVYRVLKKIGLIHDHDDSFATNIYEFVNIPFSFNVYTYLRDIYSDFGLIGIILIPYIIGAFTTYLSIRIRLKFSLPTVFLLIYLYMFIMFSVICNPFSFGMNVIGLGAAMIIGIFLNRKGVFLQWGKTT